MTDASSSQANTDAVDVARARLQEAKQYLRDKERGRIGWEARYAYTSTISKKQDELISALCADRDCLQATVDGAHTLLLTVADELSRLDKSDTINAMNALGMVLNYVKEHAAEYGLFELWNASVAERASAIAGVAGNEPDAGGGSGGG